jgi:hypothetical protein
MVLENTRHGPELCLGAVAASYPPQCGGVPVTNWDWDAVAGVERAHGSTWGVYEVIGTYNGDSFTLTEPPRPPQRTEGPPETKSNPFATPCPPPPGGWRVVDPTKVSFEAVRAARAAAAAEPDFGGHWVDQRGGSNDPNLAVLNFSFTGDLERHEADLRAIWGGLLCVTLAKRRSADLRIVQNELAQDDTLRLLSVGSGTIDGVVELTVVYDDGSIQARLNDAYGDGVVKVTSALKPIT